MKKNYINPEVEVISVDHIPALIATSEEEANEYLPTLARELDEYEWY